MLNLRFVEFCAPVPSLIAATVLFFCSKSPSVFICQIPFFSLQVPIFEDTHNLASLADFAGVSGESFLTPQTSGEEKAENGGPYGTAKLRIGVKMINYGISTETSKNKWLHVN